MPIRFGDNIEAAGDFPLLIDENDFGSGVVPASALKDAVRQGLVRHGSETPAITDDYVDGQLFATPHTLWTLAAAGGSATNTLEFTITPVSFGASIPNEIGVHRAIGTLPAAGAFPAALPAGIVGLAYHTTLQRLYIWATSELITRTQSWGEVIGFARHNLRWQDEVEYGGVMLQRYGFVMPSSALAPYSVGTPVQIRLVAPSAMFSAPAARHWMHFQDLAEAALADGTTIIGDGTSGHRFAVANPFTANDERLVDSIRYEGRVRWSGTITVGASTSGQWGENEVLRGFADTAEPISHTGETGFGSLSDNTDGTNRVYRMYYIDGDDELVFSIQGDPDLSDDVLVVDGAQGHFNVAEKLPPADTGGNFTLYTWQNFPSVLQGANAPYSIIEPLEDSDYLPDTGTGYLNRSGTTVRFKQIDYSEVANTPSAGTGTAAELDSDLLVDWTGTAEAALVSNQIYEFPAATAFTVAAADDDDLLQIEVGLGDAANTTTQWLTDILVLSSEWRNAANGPAPAAENWAASAFGFAMPVFVSGRTNGNWHRTVFTKGANGRPALLPVNAGAFPIRLIIRRIRVTGGGGQGGAMGQQFTTQGIVEDLSIGRQQIADAVIAEFSPLDDLEATAANGQVMSIVQSRHAGFGPPYNELTQRAVRIERIPVTSGSAPLLPGVVEDTGQEAVLGRFLRFSAADEGYRLNGLTGAGSAITWEEMLLARPRGVGGRQVLVSFPASPTTAWSIVMDTDGRLKPIHWDGTTATEIPGSAYSNGVVMANDIVYPVSAKLEGQNTSGQFRLSFGAGLTAELSTLANAVLMRSAAFNGVQWLAIGNHARSPAAAWSWQGDIAWDNTKVVARGTGTGDALTARQYAQGLITASNLNWEENDAPFGTPWLNYRLQRLTAPKYRYAPVDLAFQVAVSLPDDTENRYRSVRVNEFRKSDTAYLMLDISIEGTGSAKWFRDTLIPVQHMTTRALAATGTFDDGSAWGVFNNQGYYTGVWLDGEPPNERSATNQLAMNIVSTGDDDIVSSVAVRAMNAESVGLGQWAVQNLRRVPLRL